MSEQYHIPNISRESVLKYLGYMGQSITAELESCLDEQAQKCCEIAVPRGVTRLFTLVSNNGNRVALKDCDLVFESKSIAQHVKGAKSVGLLAVTLGAGIDRELKQLGYTSPLNQIVFDACATVLAEEAANAAEASLVAQGAAQSLFPNWRFSPGYGDFDITVQQRFLQVLDAPRSIGLTASVSSLLIPTKSVTALLGFFETPQPTRVSLCSECGCYDYCTIRKTGRTCRG
ncbi:MAG: hypothetical protein IKE43_06765 [Coriobacteriales bacterium]|nr:hypothetical protein [Coriobacteriales bacterium]